MEDKIYIILNEEKQMYCYIVLNSNLEDLEINKTIQKLYFDLLKENEDFSDYFEYKIKRLKNIKVKSIVYKDLHYICV